MKQIIIVKSGTLSAKEIEEIKQGGYVVIVTDTPENISFLTFPTDSSDGYISALKGLAETVYDSPRAVFVKELYSRMAKKEGK